jgi:hypothetical protein
MLLSPVVSFGPFDVTLSRVEKASALTLPDLARCRNLCSNCAGPDKSLPGDLFILARQREPASGVSLPVRTTSASIARIHFPDFLLADSSIAMS